MGKERAGTERKLGFSRTRKIDIGFLETAATCLIVDSYINTGPLFHLDARLSPLKPSPWHKIISHMHPKTPVPLSKKIAYPSMHCVELYSYIPPLAPLLTPLSFLLQLRNVILCCIVIQIYEASRRPSLSRRLSHISINSHTISVQSNSPNRRRNSHSYSSAPSALPTRSRQWPS